MATKAKKPAVRAGDAVKLSSWKSVIPSYDGKPFVGRDSVLSVVRVTGTGSTRSPWGVVVTHGGYEWHLEGDDVVMVDPDRVAAPREKSRSPAVLEREIAAMDPSTLGRDANSPELWSDRDLDAQVARYLRRWPGRHSSVRLFGAMIGELVERRRARGERGTDAEIESRIRSELA